MKLSQTLVHKGRFPFVLITGLLILSGWSVHAQAKAELAVEQYVTEADASVLSGERFSYRLRYRCASITEHCENAKVVSELPTELLQQANKVLPTGSPHVERISNDGKTVTWHFIDPLPAGSTGELSVAVELPNGSTPDGTTATNTPYITADNADTVTSNPITVTANASEQITFSKKRRSGNQVGQNIRYELKLCNAKGKGVLNLTDFVLSDSLPSGAQFVSAENNGQYQAETNTVQWPVRNLNVGKCFKTQLYLKYPQDTFNAGEEIVNEALVVGTLVGGVAVSYTGRASHRLAAYQEGKEISLSTRKNGNGSTYLGNTVSYGFYLHNNGTADLADFTVIDEIPPQLNVTEIRTLKDKNINGYIPVAVYYQTNVNSAWTAVSGFSERDFSVKVSELNLASGEYITQLKWVHDAQSGLKTTGSSKYSNSFSATVLSTDRNGEPVEFGDRIQNVMEYYYTYQGEVSEPGAASRSTRVIEKFARPDIEKKLLGSSSVSSGQAIKYELKVKNRNSTALMDPVIIDLLPEYLTVESWKVTRQRNNTAAPVVEVMHNYNGSGRQRISFHWEDYELRSWETLKIELTTRLEGLAPGGTRVLNQAYFTSATGNEFEFNHCDRKPVDLLDIDNNGNTAEQLCASKEAAFNINSVAAMEAIKWVKGQLDDQWHRYPDVGETTLGGTLDYRLMVKNTSNIAMTNIIVTDILPFVGDTGVIDGQNRESGWQPQLIGPVQTAGDITVYYSLVQNPCRSELTSSAGCSDPKWTTIVPDDITQVGSLQFDFGDIILGPGDELELTWPMYAPINAPVEAVAWNSFGYIATRTDTGTQLLPSEPIKVGIKMNNYEPALYGDYIWLDRNGNGQQDEGNGAGVNGVRVELYQPGPDGRANTADDVFVDFTLSTTGADGNAGFYLFPALPAGDYFAKFYPPIGYKLSPQDMGAFDAADSDVDPQTLTTPVTTLEETEEDLTWDMGLIEAASAALGNYVWFDRNTDGIQNESATLGLNNITVQLYQDNGDGIASVNSDIFVAETATVDDVHGRPGYYLFDELDPGQYFVHFALPDGARFTSANAASDDETDSDANADSGNTAILNLSIGDNDLTWDAGIVLPEGKLNLGNRVWLDGNEDSLYEAASEVGINGVTLNLFRDTNADGQYDAATDVQVASTATITKDGVPGYYLFKNLVAGSYFVQVDPENFTGEGALIGLVSSNGAPDPMNGIDHDDNGAPVAELGVLSAAVTLAEPPVNTEVFNLTVDFGFHKQTESCPITKVYALQDTGLNDTQFFTIDPETLVVEPLGPLYPGHDIESLDLNPFTNVLYATSGDDPSDENPHGYLYIVDPDDGSLTKVGATGYGEMSAISFNPKDGSLWGWADGEGLMKINTVTGAGEMVAPSPLKIEGLTWDTAGEILYASVEQQLWAWDGVNVYQACDELPGQTEALEMLQDDILLFAVHTADDLNIYAWDLSNVQNCEQILEVQVETQYDDIEGLTWPLECLNQ